MDGEAAPARLLVVIDDPGSESDLRQSLSEFAGDRELELRVVAPIRPTSGLDLLTGDLDDSISAARVRAANIASEGESTDAVAATEAEVGDADQLLAIEDALADFEAERIVLVEPDGNLAAAARHRFEIPVAVLNER